MDNSQQPLTSTISEQARLIPIDHRYDTFFPALSKFLWGEKSWRYSGEYHDSIEGLVRYMATTYHNYYKGKDKNYDKWLISYRNSLKSNFFYDGLRPVGGSEIQTLYKFEIAVVWNGEAILIIKQYLETTPFLYRTEIVKAALAIRDCMGEAATGLQVLSDEATAMIAYSNASDSSQPIRLGNDDKTVWGDPIVVVPITDEEKKTLVRKILFPLSGFNPQNRLIMSQENFKQLIEYTSDFVVTGILPNIDQRCTLHTIAISKEHIRYTFYLLYKKLNGSKKNSDKRMLFIEFLHSVINMEEEKSTTNSHFSRKPKTYDTDFGGYFG